MDNLITTPQAGETCLAVQELHVYRHVDSGKLQSKAPQGARTLNLRGAPLHDCFSLQPADHAKRTRIAEQQLGGALCVA
jgi:hypothetical protein